MVSTTISKDKKITFIIQFIKRRNCLSTELGYLELASRVTGMIKQFGPPAPLTNSEISIR